MSRQRSICYEMPVAVGALSQSLWGALWRLARVILLFIFFFGGRGKHKVLGTELSPLVYCLFEPFLSILPLHLTSSLATSLAKQQNTRKAFNGEIWVAPRFNVTLPKIAGPVRSTIARGQRGYCPHRV